MISAFFLFFVVLFLYLPQDACRIPQKIRKMKYISNAINNMKKI